MSIEFHRHSSTLATQAEIAAYEGDMVASAARYGEAARLEEQAFDVIPLDRERTRGIIAVSTVALYHKAGLPAEVARVAAKILALKNLPPYFAQRVMEIAEISVSQGSRADE